MKFVQLMAVTLGSLLSVSAAAAPAVYGSQVYCQYGSGDSITLLTLLTTYDDLVAAANATETFFDARLSYQQPVAGSLDGRMLLLFDGYKFKFTKHGEARRIVLTGPWFDGTMTIAVPLQEAPFAVTTTGLEDDISMTCSVPS